MENETRRHTVEDEMLKKIDDMRNLEVGWDGYDSPIPSSSSIAIAKKYVESIMLGEYYPFSILPSAEGGIGFSYRGDYDRRAIVEILNKREEGFREWIMLYRYQDNTHCVTLPIHPKWRIASLNVIDLYLYPETKWKIK